MCCTNKTMKETQTSECPNTSNRINPEGMQRQSLKTVLTCESSSAVPLSSAWWWLLLAVPSISAAMRAASCAEMRAFLQQAGESADKAPALIHARCYRQWKAAKG